MTFEPLEYIIEKVGKRVKASKRRHTWNFRLEGKSHSLVLYSSVFSCKRVLLLDGQIVFQGKGLGLHEAYRVRVGPCNLDILEGRKGYFIRYDFKEYTFEIPRQTYEEKVCEDRQQLLKKELGTNHFQELTVLGNVNRI